MHLHRLTNTDDIPALNIGHVHLWTFAQDQSSGELLDILSADERQRADRFKFDLHRGRYITRRGLLRKILSGYVGIPPKQLAFTYNPFGKPAMTGGPVFNLSHSDDLALLAVTPSGTLGVDVERVRPLEDLIDLARMNFTAAEMRAFQSASSTEQLAVFYDYWTRKEAILKAMGTGLSVPAKAVSAYGDTWHVESLQPQNDFVAALAQDAQS